MAAIWHGGVRLLVMPFVVQMISFQPWQLWNQYFHLFTVFQFPVPSALSRTLENTCIATIRRHISAVQLPAFERHFRQVYSTITSWLPWLQQVQARHLTCFTKRDWFTGKHTPIRCTEVPTVSHFHHSSVHVVYLRSLISLLENHQPIALPCTSSDNPKQPKAPHVHSSTPCLSIDTCQQLLQNLTQLLPGPITRGKRASAIVITISDRLNQTQK